MGSSDSRGRLRGKAMTEKESTTDRATAPWGFGVFLLLAGVVAIVLTGQMKVSGFTDAHDPGPDALPRVLAILMIVGGVTEVIRAVLNRRAPSDSLGAGDSGWSGCIVLVQVVLYVALLPVLGFIVSTICFSVALLRWFGASWKLALSMAVSLVAVVSLLFSQVFEVVLPIGRLGLPF